MEATPLSKMRRRVQVQSRTVTQDTYGAASQTWATVAVRWASVEPLSGREQWQAQQARPDVTHRVRLRRLAGLTARHRFLIDGRVLNITSVLDIEDRHRLHECLCVEEVT